MLPSLTACAQGSSYPGTVTRVVLPGLDGVLRVLRWAVARRDFRRLDRPAETRSPRISRVRGGIDPLLEVHDVEGPSCSTDVDITHPPRRDVGFRRGVEIASRAQRRTGCSLVVPSSPYRPVAFLPSFSSARAPARMFRRP
jgi:hypothetical protein